MKRNAARRASHSAAAILGVALAWAGPAFAEEFRYLYVLETEAPEGLDLLQRPMALRIDIAGKKEAWEKALRSLTDVRVVPDEDSFELVIEEEAPSFRREPEERHLQASWVVDFDEPAVTEVVATLPNAPTLEDLMRVTDEAIPNKSMLRSWDFPSKAVELGEGDCTEHALLLAGLARARRMPARVLIGVLFAEGPEGVQAFGHAWPEIWVDGRWQIADASWRDSPVPRLYLPTMELVNEGPSYTLDLFEDQLTPKKLQLSLPEAP